MNGNEFLAELSVLLGTVCSQLPQRFDERDQGSVVPRGLRVGTGAFQKTEIDQEVSLRSLRL
jgi:hypothetical protein